MTLPPFPRCPTGLSPDQIARYHEDGYLAFVDVLSSEEVEGARAALSELAHSLARSRDVRKKNGWWFAGDSSLYMQFEPGYEPQDADTGDLELKLRKLQEYHDKHPHFVYLSTQHARIQGVLTSMLGASPLLFQSMALVKPPRIGSEKPWHQDNAYFSVTPLGAVCGVWIALDEATVENGCMHALPGGHAQGARKHIHTFDCEIARDRIDPSGAVAVPLPPGGAMFFHGMLPHQTPPNASPERRRALQFHYRSAGSRIVGRDEYDALFAEADGTPASCAAAKK